LSGTDFFKQNFNSFSNNEQAVFRATGNSTLGQTFLSNVFAANSSLEPFISFILSRQADLNETSNEDGAFTIAEIEEGYKAIENVKPVPLYPPGTMNWTVAVDSFTVNGKSLNITSTVKGSNNTVGLLDTGTSFLLAPDETAQSIYSSMPNVYQLPIQGQNIYIIPCDQEPPKVVITIAGSAIPIHPLDLNTIYQTFLTINGSLISVCSGGIVGYTNNSDIQGAGFDLLLGDSFLRNSYTIFNFGNEATTVNNTNTTTSGGPFIKLLGITDPTTASSDFNSTRQKQLSLAPAASNSQIAQILSGNGDYIPVNTPPLNGTG
jgi:hypothetical protein